MDREQVLKQAKAEGWVVLDVRAKGIDVDIEWKHWEVISPNRGPVFRAVTEDEAWDYVYEQMTHQKPGET